jgi:hypothetical protein
MMRNCASWFRAWVWGGLLAILVCRQFLHVLRRLEQMILGFEERNLFG